MTFDVLTVHIIEGTLTRIDVEGNRHLWSGYVRGRIELGVTKPVRVTALQERLQLLQRDPHIEQLKAELKAGLALGESTLTVQVKEAPIFHARLEFNNYTAPSVGAGRDRAATNVTGLGDSLSSVPTSRGAPDHQHRYALPLNLRYDVMPPPKIRLQGRRF
jgi:hemolysin activation/secretion protein